MSFLILLLSFYVESNSILCEQNPTSKIDKIICSSAALTDIHQQVIVSYQEAVSKSNSEKTKQLEKAQQIWLKNRAQCGDQDCIHTSTMNRLTELDRLNAELEKARHRNP